MKNNNLMIFKWVLFNDFDSMLLSSLLKKSYQILFDFDFTTIYLQEVS